MITSTQRKNKVLEHIRALAERIDAPAKPGVPPHMVVVSQAQIGDRIAAISTEIEEFDAAGTADIADLQFNTIAEMFKLPIKLRLAAGQTIPQFVRSINITTSTLKRYEAAEYASAPAEVLETILSTCGLKVSGHTSRAAQGHQPPNGFAACGAPARATNSPGHSNYSGAAKGSGVNSSLPTG